MPTFRIWPGILALFTSVLIVACGSANTAPTPPATDCRTVSHAMGDTEICGRPETIVVLDGHSLDLLLSLGQQPFGVSAMVPTAGDLQIQQPQVQIPYLGKHITTQPFNVGGMGSPSLEVLTQIKPDLIVGESGRIKDTYDLLAQIAPTVLWEGRSRLGEWQTNLQTLALALGDETKAEEAIAQHTTLLAAARNTFKPILEDAPKALVLSSNQLNGGNLAAITAQSYLGKLMTDVGFELVAPPSDVNYAPFSLEVLPEYDQADHIFVLGYNTDALAAFQAGTPFDELLAMQTSGIQQEWEENAIAQSLTASKTDRVYFVPFIKWNGINGPMASQLIVDDLQQLLLNQN